MKYTNFENCKLSQLFQYETNNLNGSVAINEN